MIATVVPLAFWLLLLTLCRLPWWLKLRQMRSQLQISHQGLAHPKILWLSTQTFQLCYLGGALLQILLHLPRLNRSTSWLAPLDLQLLPLLGLAILATINFQGLLVQILNLYLSSQRHWLPPQRGRGGRWARIFWLWLYLPVLLSQLLFAGLLLPQLMTWLPTTLALVLVLLAATWLTLLLRGLNANILLGMFSLTLVNSLIFLASQSLLMTMIHCALYLYWVKLIAQKRRS